MVVGCGAFITTGLSKASLPKGGGVFGRVEEMGTTGKESRQTQQR